MWAYFPSTIDVFLDPERTFVQLRDLYMTPGLHGSTWRPAYMASPTWRPVYMVSKYILAL